MTCMCSRSRGHACVSQGTVGAYYHDMSEVIAARARVCVATAMMSEMAYRWPGTNLVGIEFSGDFASEFTRAQCEAVVWSMPVVQRTPQTAATMCALNLVAVAEVVDLDFAFPANTCA